MVKRKRKSQQNSDFEIMPLGPDGMMDLFTQFILDSDELADEPEFADFRFDPDEAYASAEKTHRKHARALRKAEQKGGEELEFLQDDMRIEAIDRLLTPPVRRDILRRLESLVARLKAQKADLDTVMMATAIQSLFEDKTFPWGMTNLLGELFQRSLGLPESAAEELQLIEQVQALLGDDLSIEELMQKSEDPDFMKELEAKIDTDSALFQKISAQATKLSDEFYDAIWHGEVEIDLFSEEELMVYLELVKERLEAAGLEPSDADSAEVSEIVQSTIDESIEKIVTAKRLKKMKKDLQSIFQTWIEDGNQFAGPLNTEIGYLEEEPPAQNAFIKNLFLTQLRWAAGNFKAEDTEEQETRQKSKRRRGRRGRRGKGK